MSALTVLKFITLVITNLPEIQMTVGQIIAIVTTSLADFKALFDDGNKPSQEQIDALITKIQAQSAIIQEQE